jgi:hypothetical protein
MVFIGRASPPSTLRRGTADETSVRAVDALAAAAYRRSGQRHTRTRRTSTA